MKAKQRSRRISHVVIGVVAVALVGATGSAAAVAVTTGHPRSPGGFAIERLPSGKASELQRELARRDAARQNPAPKNAGYAPTPQLQPPRVSSIIVMHESPMPAMSLTVNDMWQGPVGDIWVLAYAGAYHDVNAGTETPAVVLYSEPVDPNAPDQSLQFLGVYPAPRSEATVTITGANGDVLQLTGDGGQSLAFDAATRTYSG
jgi:hypothetical protein